MGGRNEPALSEVERAEPLARHVPTKKTIEDFKQNRVDTVRRACFVLQIGMEITLTAVFRKFPEGYAAFVEELPGANTQGATLEEARENLKEAVEMVLQANRELAEESLHGAEVLRERLAITAA
jgi:predicted RNase H-like HicB family nuclease